MPKSLKQIANIISIVFHPIFIPLYAVFIIFNSGTAYSYVPDTIKNFSYLIIIASTIIMPMSVLPLLKFQKIISSYSLNDRKERIIPMVLSVIFFFMGFFLISKIPMTNLLQSFYKAMMVIVSGVALISLYWKISMHMSAIGGLCATTILISSQYSGGYFSWAIALIFIAGLLGSSRLLLGRHTPTQVYTGFLWGFSCVSVALLLS